MSCVSPDTVQSCACVPCVTCVYVWRARRARSCCCWVFLTMKKRFALLILGLIPALAQLARGVAKASARLHWNKRPPTFSVGTTGTQDGISGLPRQLR